MSRFDRLFWMISGACMVGNACAQAFGHGMLTVLDHPNLTGLQVGAGLFLLAYGLMPERQR